jgi:tol-pal system protein YbgF
MKSAFFKRLLIVVMSFGITTLAFADDAPVYEVDNYPPSFDGSDMGGNDSVETGAIAPQTSFGTSRSSSPSRYTPPPRPMTNEQRLARMEQQIINLQQSATSEKIEDLQKEVQGLRGQVEDLTHQLQQAQTQQRAMYSDLDKRLTPPDPATLNRVPDIATPPPEPLKEPVLAKPAVKSRPTLAAATIPPVEKPTSQNQPNVAEEQQIYQTAYDLIKSKKYNEAINALQKMLQKYPSGQFAANAHYWLGELYGLVNKHEQSALEFATVVKNYPESPKVSDAQLKLGLIYVAQFKWPDAKAAFNKVITQYPGTSSARTASEQLKQIKLAGH